MYSRPHPITSSHGSRRTIRWHHPLSSRGRRPRYLLLDYGHHWDYAKGHVEAGETDTVAALRELAEETSITDARLIDGFTRQIVYFFRSKQKRKPIRKTVIFFLAQTLTIKVTLSHEHTAHAWLDYHAALQRLTFPTAKELLQAAHEFHERLPQP